MQARAKQKAKPLTWQDVLEKSKRMLAEINANRKAKGIPPTQIEPVPVPGIS
jgi:uncharacterized protein YkwD